MKVTLIFVNSAFRCALRTDAEASGGSHAPLTILSRSPSTIRAPNWDTRGCHERQGRYHREAAATTFGRNEAPCQHTLELMRHTGDLSITDGERFVDKQLTACPRCSSLLSMLLMGNTLGNDATTCARFICIFCLGIYAC